MRVTVSMPSTGVVYAPGLAQPVVFEDADLSTSDADTLKALLKQADFFGQHSTAEGAGRPVADGQQYKIVVEDGKRVRSLSVSGPFDDIANEDERKLVIHLVDMARLLRRQRANSAAKKS